jgi:hypothetical protein
MAEPDNKGPDKAGPPQGQPASGSEGPAASADQHTPSTAVDAAAAEVLNAMRAAEEAVASAVQGIAKLHDKQ